MDVEYVLRNFLTLQVWVFPLCFTAAWFAITSLGPNGSWGNIGYALSDWRSAAQVCI
jgi:hypothetical protein